MGCPVKLYLGGMCPDPGHHHVKEYPIPFADHYLRPAHNILRDRSIIPFTLLRRVVRKNITVSINDRVYRDVRVWCARRNTSISAVVQRFLEDLPQIKACRQFPLPGAPLAPVFKSFINSPGPAAPETPPPPPANSSCDPVSEL